MNNSIILKAGTILRNTYSVDCVLGEGGFGITYLASHVGLKKKMAIKEFFPQTLCNRDADTSHVICSTDANNDTVEKFRNKFLKEAEHIAEMDSPYIVRITDVFEENDTAYYVMDYIEGRTLSELVKAGGPLKEEQAVEYIKIIGNALTYIHSKRMNHLDVKPTNIMVRSKDNTPILIDFGLSKQYDSSGNQTSTTPVGISHGYAPIEQYRDGGVRKFSPQTDVYSLAATFYFLLSGVTPPQASDLIEEDLSFPAIIRFPMQRVISKAMSSTRKARYDSISDFIKDVTNAVFNDNTIAYSSDTVIDCCSNRDAVKDNLNSRSEINGYEFVDLGLPSRKKWATCNVGAETPEDYGEYFAWGEVRSKEIYSDDTYVHCSTKKNIANLFKSITGGIKGYRYRDIKCLTGRELDVADVEWGHPWHIPTVKDFNELLRCCTWKWTKSKGVNGYLVVGPNGNSVFLPAAGEMESDSLESDNTDGWYWSSEPDDSIESWAMSLTFDKKEKEIQEMGKECGLTIRPVAN